MLEARTVFQAMQEVTNTSQPLDLQSSNVTPAKESSPPTTAGTDSCCNSVAKLSDSQSTPVPALAAHF